MWLGLVLVMVVLAVVLLRVLVWFDLVWVGSRASSVLPRTGHFVVWWLYNRGRVPGAGHFFSFSTFSRNQHHRKPARTETGDRRPETEIKPSGLVL